MDANLQNLSDIFKAFADPTRLRLLKLLSGQSIVFCGGECDGETFLCVGALAEKLEVTQSAVSQHLRILRQAGLVKGERKGTFMHYSIDKEGIGKYRALMAQTMGERFVSG
ncbi:MAG: metalloregulator ArsR/SmtB family transcription factor [Desulfobacteraceae bacterium]|jgi:DNA-binding transcriptional ArsR family regulator